MTRTGTSEEGVGMIETFLEKVNHDFPGLEARRVAPLTDKGTFFRDSILMEVSKCCFEP